MGYVKNCLLIPKESETFCALFHGHPADTHFDKPVVDCFLDGYAVIPMEEYKRLKEKCNEPV